MAQNNSPFAPFGAPQPEEELLYPEQGMRFGNTNNLLMGEQSTGNEGFNPASLAAIQGMFGFASQAAANTSGSTLPQLIGGPRTTQGVPVGPNTPPQYTGNAPARPVPGTQLAPQGQPPALRAAGGSPVTGTARPMPGTARPMPGTQIAVPGPKPQFNLMGTFGNIASAATKGFVGGAALTPNTMGDGTISGAIDNLVAAGDIEGAKALGYEPIQFLGEGTSQPAMSRLGDEPLVFNQPTGPSSTATQAAPLAETLPYDAGLMGAPGIQETGIPTTSINIDGGSATVPQGLAGQTFGTLNPLKEAEAGSPQAIFERIRAKGQLSPELIAAGQARADAMGTTFDPETGFSRDAYLEGQANLGGPMGVDETRARLGGRTLNEYLNAPDGTPGVSGLRTDPQGRMIPSGFETRADAYGDYERDAAAREARLDARMQQPGESITARDTRNAAARTQSSQNVPTDVREAMLTPEGRRTPKQINRLARWGSSTQGQEMGGVAGLEQSLQPVDAQQQQYDAMRLQKLGLELDRLQQEDPDKYTTATSEVDGLIAAGIITPDKRSDAILSKMGYDPEELLGSGLDGGGVGGNANIPQSAIDYLKNNPDAASDFDAKYGAGSSGKYLT